MSVYAENLEKCRGLSFVAEKNVTDVWLRQSYRTKMCLHVFCAYLRGLCLDLICPDGASDKLQWLITGLADKMWRTCQKCYWVWKYRLMQISCLVVWRPHHSTHVDESATELSLLPHHVHGTGWRQIKSCCNQQTRLSENWKLVWLCIWTWGNMLTFLMCRRSNSRGAQYSVYLGYYYCYS